MSYNLSYKKSLFHKVLFFWQLQSWHQITSARPHTSKWCQCAWELVPQSNNSLSTVGKALPNGPKLINHATPNGWGTLNSTDFHFCRINSRSFSYLISITIFISQVLLLSVFYQWGPWGLERLSSLSEVTHGLNAGAIIQTQANSKVESLYCDINKRQNV